MRGVRVSTIERCKSLYDSIPTQLEPRNQVTDGKPIEAARVEIVADDFFEYGFLLILTDIDAHITVSRDPKRVYAMARTLNRFLTFGARPFAPKSSSALGTSNI